MTLVRSGIREAEPWLAYRSLGIWKVSSGCGQQNAWLYHGELCTGLFECPHSMAAIQERNHNGSCSVLCRLASGDTHCHFSCIPLDAQPTIVQFGRLLSNSITSLMVGDIFEVCYTVHSLAL